MNAGGAEYLTHSQILRIFDYCPVASIQEDAARQIQRLLKAIDDDDL